MEDPARVIGEPPRDLGMLVGGVVVGDGMDNPARPDSALNGVEELDELLVGVAGHAAADHGAVEDVEGRQTGWWCRCACSRGSWCRICRASWAGRAGCDRAPGSAISRRSR